MSLFAERLREIVGETNVIDREADMEPYLVDARRRYRGQSGCVVRPGSVEEVSQIVKLCARTGTKIVPQGGNTGMCGGATPVQGGDCIVLAMGRMNRIRHTDPVNNTIAVDAGCTLLAVQDKAAEVGRLFPLSLGSEGSCQIGGNIATNAGGTSVLRYGPMRDLVMGLEVVMPDGQILDGMKHLRKDNTGYALRQLFIGSEGTLGIITGAVLKLFPQPTDHATAILGLASIENALDLLARLQTRTGGRVSNFEIMSKTQYDLVLGLPRRPANPLSESHAWVVVTELTDVDPAEPVQEQLTRHVMAAMESGLVDEAILAASETQARHFWEIRHSVTEANIAGGKTVSHDTAVPVARVPDFVHAIEREAAARLSQAKVVFVGHVGDGNIHAVFVFPPSSPDIEILAGEANRLVDEVTIALGGSISAEHGIGRSNRNRLSAYLAPQELDLMTGIKTLCDPQNLMNPGALFSDRGAYDQ